MADIAAEIKETKAVGTPEKEVEKKVVEKEIIKEKEVVKATEPTEEAEKEEAKATNGEKEAEPTENGDSTDGDKCCAIKRKSVGGGDATDAAVTETNGVSEEKKAKLEESAAENGDAKEAEAKA